MTMTETAYRFATAAYDDDGNYCRPSDLALGTAGGIKTESSNWDADGATVPSGYSFSPTDVWEFPDGSSLVVDYSGCSA